MQTSSITGVQELKKNLLEISINFFNINELSECFVFNEKCNGCHTQAQADTTEEMLTKKICCIISESIFVLGSVAETLLSSNCIIGEEKIFLANSVRSLACDIKVFLFARSHIISSRDADKWPICDCNNHKNINTLIDIFFSVVDIK